MMLENKDPIYAGELLLTAKTNIRNMAIAITETATPEVRAMLTKHLNTEIMFHQKIFNYMQSRGLYPAYDLEELLENDLHLAHLALSQPVKM